MSNNSAEQPSSVYIFVVLALATFLTLFTFFRRPGITYETQVTFRATEFDGKELSPSLVSSHREDVESQLLNPEFVLDAMRHASFVQGDTNEEMLGIAKSISSRMRVRAVPLASKLHLQLFLDTDRPESGMHLLESMMHNMVAQADDGGAKLVAHPAAVSGQRGGSVTTFDLILISIASSLTGAVGLFMAERARPSNVLFTPRDVDSVAGVPVVGNLVKTPEFPQYQREAARSRRFRFVLRIAELSIAAVFLLMIYHLATRDALVSRFVNDPLAAYGEVLTHLLT